MQKAPVSAPYKGSFFKSPEKPADCLTR